MTEWKDRRTICMGPTDMTRLWEAKKQWSAEGKVRRFTHVHEPTRVPAVSPQATRSALGVTSILQELFLASAAN